MTCDSKINIYANTDFVLNTYMHWSFRRLMNWKILVAQQQEGLAFLTSEKWSKIKISLVLCLCFVDRCLSFCTFPFGHYVVCPSIYGL